MMESTSVNGGYGSLQLCVYSFAWPICGESAEPIHSKRHFVAVKTDFGGVARAWWFAASLLYQSLGCGGRSGRVAFSVLHEQMLGTDSWLGASEYVKQTCHFTRVTNFFCRLLCGLGTSWWTIVLFVATTSWISVRCPLPVSPWKDKHAYKKISLEVMELLHTQLLLSVCKPLRDSRDSRSSISPFMRAPCTWLFWHSLHTVNPVEACC